jgi:hypothetical protein
MLLRAATLFPGILKGGPALEDLAAIVTCRWMPKRSPDSFVETTRMSGEMVMALRLSQRGGPDS